MTGVDRSNEKQQGFLLWMRRNGYRVIGEGFSGNCPTVLKRPTWMLKFAVDMVALVDYYDTAVLVSGDGDLAYAADAASYRGARIEVVSLRSMTSDNLINVADRYIDLEGVKNDIKKRDPWPPFTLPTLTVPCRVSAMGGRVI